MTQDATGGMGHNSPAAATLRQFIERIERLEQEKADLAADVREVYAEAKASGFDAPAMRKIVSLRKKDAAKLAEQSAVVRMYAGALGMQGDLFA
jgi:uncharacterized protein (UPF0335 family)